MRQFRRSTPNPSLTALRALAGVLVAAAVLSAPVHIDAQAPERPARAAQPAEPPAPTAAAPVAPYPSTERRNAEETRDRLREVIQQYSPTLMEVFRHDPSLLRNADYLSSYPALAGFLQQHPEVGHNPAYFVGEPNWHRERDPRSAGVDLWRDMMQVFAVMAGFALGASVLIWLIKTLIDYRRWLRLTRIQTEAHTKLLDRITANEDLMAYMQSPSGRRFLESAPIALDASTPRAVSAPVSRILLSIQAGVVLACGGVGFIYASGRVIPEVAPGLLTVGILSIAFGVGFFVSAILAYGLSERLGLLAPSSRSTTE
jgi:hypothetical protein